MATVKGGKNTSGIVMDAAAKRRVGRMLRACERVERAADRRGLVFVPDDGAQLSDADRIAAAALALLEQVRARSLTK